MSKLYHGTSLKALHSILSEGLQTRDSHGHDSHWTDHESGSDRVYLTNAYAPFFAQVAGGEANALPVILEIDQSKLEGWHMVPDEDFVEQVMRSQYESGQATTWLEVGGSMERVTRHCRDMIEAYGHLHEDSLKYLGTCAYMEDIPPECITGVLIVESGPASLRAISDPSITLLNYQIMGSYYRNVTGYLFGLDESAFESDPVMSSMNIADLTRRIEFTHYASCDFERLRQRLETQPEIEVSI